MTSSWNDPSTAPRPPTRSDEKPDVDQAKLWAGAVAAAVVAALVAAVVLLVARGVFEVPVFVQHRDGAIVNASLFGYAVGAAFLTLLAAGLLDLLLLAAPKPFTFFSWIVVLAIIVAGVLPLTVSVNTDSTIATIVGNVVIGVTILILISSIGRSAVRNPHSVR